MNLLEKRLELITNCLSIATLESQKVCTEIAQANEYGYDVDSLDHEQLDALQTAQQNLQKSLSTLDEILTESADENVDPPDVGDSIHDGRDFDEPYATEPEDRIYEI